MKEKSLFSTAILEYIREYTKTRGEVNAPSQSTRMLIRPNYDDASQSISDSCLVIRIGEIKQINNEYFIEFFICSTLNNHKENTIEWHDLTWCAKWEFLTVLN